MKSKTVSNRNTKLRKLLYDYIIFHTKYNRPMLKGKIRFRAKQIICEILDDLGCEAIEINIQPNHVHLLFGFPPTLPPSKIVNKINGISSLVLRREFPILVKTTPKTLWMPKVMHVLIGNEMDRVKQYIRGQDSRHRDRY